MSGRTGFFVGVGVMRYLPLMVSLVLSALLAGCGGGSPNSSSQYLPVHCLNKPIRGPCKARIPGYYYDYPSNSCRKFNYGGCRGRIPFKTRSACTEACVGRR